MNWKKFIFEEDQKTSSSKKAIEQEKVIAFPNNTSTNSFTYNEKSESKTLSKGLSCEPYMQQVSEMYEKGFNSLNQDGVDFFEFYKALVDSGEISGGTVRMAYKMIASAANINKELLLEQSNFYIEEIEKVHFNFTKQGTENISDLESKQAKEINDLKNHINYIKTQINELNEDLSICEKDLSNVDSKYVGQKEELNCKIMANDYAKEKLLSSINKVVQSIKTNL